MAAAGGASTGATLEGLPWDNYFADLVPIDRSGKKGSRTVPGAVYASVVPTPVKNPRVVALAHDALALASISSEQAARPDAAAYLAGNQLFEGAAYLAHNYCGHQFGHFSGQLGDGATMTVGWLRAPGVAADSPAASGPGCGLHHVELQFKGAGLTPFSRTADGRKVLRSSVREFLCCEALHTLGVPTTRAGSVVTSDSTVVRDIFYSGDPIMEKCTIITRLAPTFLRFGSFQISAGTDAVTGRAGPSPGNTALLAQLVDATVRSFYPEVAAAHPEDSPEDTAHRALGMLREVTLRTARLVASWQLLGFCHGVLNTDNMSILGLFIDAGPFGWMETHDPEFICNASDDQGRYSYENQPGICQWNCVQLARALLPVLGGLDWKEAVNGFAPEYQRAYNDGARRKLGLGFVRAADEQDAAAAAAAARGEVPPAPQPAWGTVPSPGSQSAEPSGGLSPGDESLVEALLGCMAETGADFTNTWRALMTVDLLGADIAGAVRAAAGAAAGGEAEAAQPPGEASAASAAGARSDPSAAPAASAIPLITDPASDPVLAFLLTQTSTAAQAAEKSKPRAPLARLQQMRTWAASDPAMAENLEAIDTEIAKHAVYAAKKARTDVQKKEEDARVWAAWLQRYRTRLLQELPAELRGWYGRAAASDAVEGAGSSSGEGAGAAEAKGESMPAPLRAQLRRLSAARSAEMRVANPLFVLRNWIAHVAIKAAEEKGDFTVVQAVHARLADPYGLRDDGGAVAAMAQLGKGGVPAGAAAGGSAAGRAGCLVAAGMTVSGVSAPIVAAEGAERETAAYERAAGGAGSSAPAAGGGSCGASAADAVDPLETLSRGIDFAGRAPAWALELKVT